MSDASQLLTGLPAWARELLAECARAASAREETAYLVGGPVRDLILGQPVDDIDVMIVGDGLAVAQAVSRQLGGKLTRYHAFQTARVDLPAGHRLDVATARSETYRRPGELPRVASGTLTDDLSRRDFTINAMAIELGEVPALHDPFAGRADLDHGLVRFLHERSFADDPTRMLRALRFAVRFGYELEARTATAMRDGVTGDYLGSLTGDRMRRELAKLLAEDPVRAPEALATTGLLSGVHGQLRVDRSLLVALADQGELRGCIAAHEEVGPQWPVTLAALALDLPTQERWTLARRLSMSRQDRRPLIDSGRRWADLHARLQTGAPSASAVAEVLDDLDVRVVMLGLAKAEAGGDAALASRLYRYLELGRWLQPALTGDDLVELGQEPGPGVGRLLRRLRAARLDGEAQDAADERRLVAEWTRLGAN